MFEKTPCAEMKFEMKKPFFTIYLLFLCSIAGAAQENSAAWQYYKGDAGEFYAEFPSQPKSSPIRDAASKVTAGILYKAYLNKTFYFVVACQGTNCPQFEVIKKLKFRARFAGGAQYSEKTLEDTSLETSFLDSEGFYHKIRQIKNGPTNLLVQTLSETPSNEDVERFFKSFQLAAPNDEAQKFDREKFDKWLVTDPYELESEPKPKPVANPSNPLDDQTPATTLKEPQRTVPISILSKPPANYTDAARAYEISGEVILRVTFLSTKNVSTVTPVRKLPFGLTEQAIAVASGIAFTPAIKEGKPVTATKSVIYTFAIN